MISAVKMRELSLANSYRPNPPFNIKSLYEMVKFKSYNSNNAKNILEFWQELNPDQVVAASMAFDILSEAYEHDSKTNIEKFTKIYSEAIVPKVRSAIQLQDSIKRRFGYMKSKLSTKIQNKLSGINDAHKRENPVTQQPEPTQQAPGTPKTESVLKSYKTILQSIQECITADRIISNHIKLNKRYNIDGFVKESVFTASQVKDAVYEFCKLVDTYKIPTKAKFSIAIENSLYAFDKNHVPYNRKDILEAATEYFLMTHHEHYQVPVMINEVLNMTTLYKPEDYRDLDIAPNRVYFENNNIFSKESLDGITIFNESEAKKVVNKFKQAANISKAKEAIKAFKLSPDKDPKHMEAMIRKIFVDSDKDILDETPNLLGMILTFFVIGFGFSISAVIGILTTMTVAFVKLHWSAKETDRQIGNYERHLKKVEKKIDSTSSTETKERLTAYRDQLKKDIEKLKDYRNSLKSEREKEEDELNNLDDDDFTFEANLITDIIAIDKAIQYISENTKDCHLLEETKIKANTLSTKDFDYITEFAIANPEFLDPTELKYIIQEQRKSVLNTYKNRVDKYVRSSILSENVYKLKEYEDTNHTPKIIQEQSVGTVIHNLSELMLSIGAINESLDDTPVSEVPLLELSFGNTINMAIERVKKAATELSDKEKIISKTIDTSLENLKDALTHAMDLEDREAVIRGQILPPASRIIKTAIITGAAWLVNPAIAVIGLITTFAISMKNRAKERQIILNELDVELDMCNRYIKEAEDKNDLKAIRRLLTIKKKLEAQRARLKYKIKIEYDENLPTKVPSGDYDND